MIIGSIVGSTSPCPVSSSCVWRCSGGVAPDRNPVRRGGAGRKLRQASKLLKLLLLLLLLLRRRRRRLRRRLVLRLLLLLLLLFRTTLLALSQ